MIRKRNSKLIDTQVLKRSEIRPQIISDARASRRRLLRTFDKNPQKMKQQSISYDPLSSSAAKSFEPKDSSKYEKNGDNKFHKPLCLKERMLIKLRESSSSKMSQLQNKRIQSKVGKGLGRSIFEKAEVSLVPGRTNTKNHVKRRSIKDIDVDMKSNRKENRISCFTSTPKKQKTLISLQKTLQTSPRIRAAKLSCLEKERLLSYSTDIIFGDSSNPVLDFEGPFALTISPSKDYENENSPSKLKQIIRELNYSNTKKDIKLLQLSLRLSNYLLGPNAC